MPKELPKTYDPKAVEPRIYQMWLDGKYFHAEPDDSKEPFTMVLPPPNVTGQLHLGHAFNQTLQDILARFKRMQGYNVLWLPGVDHAGIATQIRVEQSLKNEKGLTRHDLGRDKFLEHVWAWKEKYGSRIMEQCRILGSSCDWDRTRFTMDEMCSKAVREVFVRLYEQDLIYKGQRITNWCPNCSTVLSDTEVVHEESAGHLWHIRYPVKDSDEFVVVATTRPETMLGDTAVAVHPDDERFTHLVGKTVILPLMNREIPVVADEYVDREFGTGVVKITPSHDPNDFEVALRHDLPRILVLDGHAVINQNGGKYEGLTREEARKTVVADLDAQGLLVRIDDHPHSVGHCDRCKTRVEPIASNQWFVKMKPLAGPAIKAVKEGEIKFVPAHMSKIYMNWMENVRDWCISRQLWWGHQIPAWTCAECGKITVSRQDATECIHCHSKQITQESDVLDTWFSSALWPFETLGWPENTRDLEYFYPSSVLVTAYEIIFLWVARMIFSGINYLGKPPFHTVMIHGLMRDNLGRKMSKSLDNGVDPIEVVDQYGADALRMNIVTGVSPGNDTRYLPERCEAMGNFCNKLWNASRFTLLHVQDEDIGLPEPSALAQEDKWILTRLSQVVTEITENMEHYELGVAAQKLYEFIWSEFCDWYIELTKPRLMDGDEASKQTARRVLNHVLTQSLALLHPFMPHITEEIWQTLPHKGESLMISAWPTVDRTYVFEAQASDMERVMEVIRAIRARRAELQVPPSKKAPMTIVTNHRSAFEEGVAYIAKLAGGSDIKIDTIVPVDQAGLVRIVTPAAQVFLPLAELVDLQAERLRLEKSLGKTAAEIAKLSSKLKNPNFLNKAPAAVVATEEARLAELQALESKLSESLNALPH